MACTAMFGNGTGNGWGGLGPTPTDLDKKFTLKQVHIATFDRLAYDLLIEFTLIKDMAEVKENSTKFLNGSIYLKILFGLRKRLLLRIR
jgi:hypothetical protein